MVMIIALGICCRAYGEQAEIPDIEDLRIAPLAGLEPEDELNLRLRYDLSANFQFTWKAILQFNNSNGSVSSITRSLGEQAVRALTDGVPIEHDENEPFINFNLLSRKFEGHALIDWDALNASIKLEVITAAIAELAFNLHNPSLALAIPCTDNDPPCGPLSSLSSFAIAQTSEYRDAFLQSSPDSNSRWLAWAARVEIIVALERAAVQLAQECALWPLKEQDNEREDGEHHGTAPPLWHDGTHFLRQITASHELHANGGNDFFAGMYRKYVEIATDDPIGGWYFQIMRLITLGISDSLVGSLENSDTWNSGETCLNPVQVTSTFCECVYTVGRLCLVEHYKHSKVCIYFRESPDSLAGWHAEDGPVNDDSESGSVVYESEGEDEDYESEPAW